MFCASENLNRFTKHPRLSADEDSQPAHHSAEAEVMLPAAGIPATGSRPKRKECFMPAAGSPQHRFRNGRGPTAGEPKAGRIRSTRRKRRRDIGRVVMS